MTDSSRDDLIKDYLRQGYQEGHAKWLADKVLNPDPQPAKPAAARSAPARPTPRASTAGRRQAANGGQQSTEPPAVPVPTQATLRAWAKAKGVKVPPRGAVPKLVREMYDEAMRQRV